MDCTMGPGVGALRAELRGLVAEHVPHDYLGAFTHDPADLEIAHRDAPGEPGQVGDP